VTRRPDDPASDRRSSLVSSVLQTYAANVGAAVFSLVNVLIVARALGPVGRGDVAFLTAIAWLTSNVAALGVQEANVNLAGAEPRLRRALATNSVILSALFGAASSGALIVLIALFPGVAGESDSSLRWLVFAALPMLVLQIYLRFLVQADYGFALANAAYFIPAVLNVVANAALAALDIISVGTAVATWVVGQLIGTLMLAWYVARRSAGFGRPQLHLARRTLGFGLKSHAGRVMLLGNYRLDQWLLGGIAGSRELGLYSVAVAWAEALWYLPTALAAVQRPDLVRATLRDAARQTATAFRAVVLVTALMVAVAIVAAPVLCVTVFGEGFRGSIDDLRILSLGALGIVALKQLGSALTAQGRPLNASAAIGVAFAATVVLDVLLIPPYGGAGAAIASTVSYTAGGLVIAVIFAQALGGRLTELVPRGNEAPALWRAARGGFRSSVRRREEASALADSGDELTP
jgi:O-antigen/teichoic acid export membrane protein